MNEEHEWAVERSCGSASAHYINGKRERREKRCDCMRIECFDLMEKKRNNGNSRCATVSSARISVAAAAAAATMATVEAVVAVVAAAAAV